MELVQEMMEAQCVDQEPVLKRLFHIGRNHNVKIGKQVVPQMARAVKILNLLVHK